MITLYKVEAADAIKTAIRDSSSTAGQILGAQDNEVVTLTHTQTFRVPAKYAKAILK
jgi:hypothetical protein